MINNLLNIMYHLNIEIKEVDNKIKLVYKNGILEGRLKEKIIHHKKDLIQRIKENEIAKEKGFLVYNHGLFYEYRYGRGSFLYIERLSNGKATALRANYRPDEQTPYKTVVIAQSAPFSKAYQDSIKFIDWLNKRKGKRVG